jgi:hypothetical protein
MTVYRGCPAAGESHDEHGLAWTLNLEKAWWFAKRFFFRGRVRFSRVG